MSWTTTAPYAHLERAHLEAEVARLRAENEGLKAESHGPGFVPGRGRLYGPRVEPAPSAGDAEPTKPHAWATHGHGPEEGAMLALAAKIHNLRGGTPARQETR